MGRRILVSFVSVVGAWAIALLCVTLYSFSDQAWEWSRVPGDMLTFAAFLGATIVVTWAIFLAPLVLVVKDDNSLYSIKVFPFFGAGYALVAAALLAFCASSVSFDSTPFMFYGALSFWPVTMGLGAVTGLTFAIILKSHMFRSR
jgi:hypothetical protein